VALSRRPGYKRIQHAPYRGRSDTDLVNHRRDLSFSHRWFLLLSTGTFVMTLLLLVVILTGHRRKAHAFFEKLNQVQDNLKNEEEAVLRKIHRKHRNGQNS
jgi:low affinity Fe/Cu permease